MLRTGSVPVKIHRKSKSEVSRPLLKREREVYEFLDLDKSIGQSMHKRNRTEDISIGTEAWENMKSKIQLANQSEGYLLSEGPQALSSTRKTKLTSGKILNRTRMFRQINLFDRIDKMVSLNPNLVAVGHIEWRNKNLPCVMYIVSKSKEPISLYVNFNRSANENDYVLFTTQRQLIISANYQNSVYNFDSIRYRVQVESNIDLLLKVEFEMVKPSKKTSSGEVNSGNHQAAGGGYSLFKRKTSSSDYRPPEIDDFLDVPLHKVKRSHKKTYSSMSNLPPKVHANIENVIAIDAHTQAKRAKYFASLDNRKRAFVLRNRKTILENRRENLLQNLDKNYLKRKAVSLA